MLWSLTCWNHRLSNLPNYECLCKLVSNGRLDEHSISTEPITRPKNPGMAKETIKLSKKLARSREVVENDIKTKMSTIEIFNKPKAFEKILKEGK
jgi:hypothetical protein